MQIFDIIGPIMIGPSSSHTAGAARIGRLARLIAGANFNRVIFDLHGSFAATYSGHGTDKALLAGVMGMKPDDERIRTAFKIADDNKLHYEFRKVNLGAVHPNTVKIRFLYEDGHEFYVIGSSIGGGNVEIININDTAVSFTGDFSTMILRYKEQKGIIAFISTLLAENGYNIESLRTVKDMNNVSLILETDRDVSDEIKKIINSEKRLDFVKYIDIGR